MYGHTVHESLVQEKPELCGIAGYGRSGVLFGVNIDPLVPFGISGLRRRSASGPHAEWHPSTKSPRKPAPTISPTPDMRHR